MIINGDKFFWVVILSEEKSEESLKKIFDGIEGVKFLSNHNGECMFDVTTQKAADSFAQAAEGAKVNWRRKPLLTRKYL
ncbi:MAG: hypothetical protein MRY79_08035 [Alphaproteobacteria bacterium]|nr:hypothetical protein [Alphaproteobacteria bacterium]